MAGTNSNGGKNVRYYSLKAKADETNTPHFVVSEKNAEGKYKPTDKFDSMEGMLNSADIKQKEYPAGVFTNIFVLNFEDDNEISVVEMTHNSITYNIINSLANDCNKLDKYTIQVYKKPASNKGGKFFGAASIKINGERLDWHIDPKSAPQKEPVIVNGAPFMQNGQPVFDTTKVKAFWEGIYNEKIIGAIGKTVKRGSTTAAPVNSAADVSDPNVEQLEDDELENLPF